MADFFSNEDVSAANSRSWDERERIIAECMREAGFEYFLSGPVAEQPDPEPTGPMPEDRLEWVTLYGYGQFVDGPYLRGTVGSVLPDLNGEYQASLNSEAQSAYRATYWGTEPAWAGDGDEDVPLSEQGCSGRAEAYGLEHDPYRTPEWTWVQDAMNATEEAALRDARVTEAVLAFTTCMAQAGFPEIVSVWDEGNGFAFIQEQYAELMAASGKARVRDLDELGRLEIDVAVAEELCVRETGARGVRSAVLAEYEQEFIESYRAELEERLMAIAEMVE